MCDNSRSKTLIGGVMLGVLLTGGLLLALLASPGEAIGATPEMAPFRADDGATALVSTAELTHHVYLPLIARDYGPRSFRIGYCAVGGGITRYPALRDLAAGWYLDFNVRSDPPQPLGMEHVQTVRLHQLTECWPEQIRDRKLCPYVKDETGNYTYTLTSPSTKTDLRSRVKANPGALWLIGNEMDRYDWGVRDPNNPGEYLVPPGGQDEMLPELYATAYYELYHLIKEEDPTAKVAIGGMIQATPARLWYLETVWDTYFEKYETNMPVDVWNIHNFIFKERCDDYGADVPPGYYKCEGTIYKDGEHNSLAIFDQQIRRFRQWMKNHGQRNKPLIVSEYGIVYRHAGMNDPVLVRDFMLSTFDYFRDAKDSELGYPADGDRLVQRWAWYSLDDADPNKNDYAHLFNPDTLQMTALGRAFASYAQDHLDVQGDQELDFWANIP